MLTTDRQTDRQTDRTELTGYPSIDRPWLKYYSEEAINAKIPEGNLYNYIVQENQGRMSEIMMTYLDTRITYDLFVARVNSLVSHFICKGIKKGDIVTLMSLVTPETIYCIYALNRIGAVVNSLYISMSAEELTDVLLETDSKMLIFIDVIADKILAVAEKLPVKEILMISIGDSLPVAKRFLYRLKNKRPASEKIELYENLHFESDIKVDELLEKTKSDEVAVIMYTSGTTGNPKGVELTNSAINSVALQYLMTMEHRPGENFMGFIPPFFSIGFSLATHMPLVLGLRYDICPNPDPEVVSKTYLKIKPNHYVGAPSNNLRILELIKGDLSFIKTFAAGGASCTLEQERWVNELLKKNGSGAKFITGYGMTEFSATVTTSRNNAYKEGTLGIPLPLVNVKVFDPETKEELPYNQVGELAFNSPGAFVDYYKLPEETDEIIERDSDGVCWIRTGDLGKVDEDGFVYFCGRLKRIFLKKGDDGTLYKIFPQRLEELLTNHDAVSEAAVIVKEDEKLLHIQIAFVTAEKEVANRGEYADMLKNHCIDELPSMMVPEDIVILKDIPHKSNGKIDYIELEHLYDAYNKYR